MRPSVFPIKKRFKVSVHLYNKQNKKSVPSYFDVKNKYLVNVWRGILRMYPWC